MVVCVCVYVVLYVCVLYACVVHILLYHSTAYSFEKESVTEPGARLATINP